MNHDQRGDPIGVDLELKNARAEEFDALVLPGGVANPDKLRLVPEAIKFVEAFVHAQKPIAAKTQTSKCQIQTSKDIILSIVDNSVSQSSLALASRFASRFGRSFCSPVGWLAICRSRRKGISRARVGPGRHRRAAGDPAPGQRNQLVR